MTGHDLLLIANAIICGGCAAGDVLPAQRIAPPPVGGWIAYFLIVAAASTRAPRTHTCTTSP
jgi:hypothetical protein